jgi:hypothetical protein
MHVCNLELYRIRGKVPRYNYDRPEPGDGQLTYPKRIGKRITAGKPLIGEVLIDVLRGYERPVGIAVLINPKGGGKNEPDTGADCRTGTDIKDHGTAFPDIRRRTEEVFVFAIDYEGFAGRGTREYWRTRYPTWKGP